MLFFGLLFLYHQHILFWERLSPHTQTDIISVDLDVFKCIVIKYCRQSLCIVWDFFLLLINTKSWDVIVGGSRFFVTYYRRIISACANASIPSHIQTWSLTGAWPLFDRRVRVICDWMIMDNNRMNVVGYIWCINSSVYAPISWWCWPPYMTNAIFHWRLALIRRRVAWGRRVWILVLGMRVL